MLAGRTTLPCKHRVADAFLASSSSPRCCAPRSTFRQFLNCEIASIPRVSSFLSSNHRFLPHFRPDTRVSSNAFLLLPSRNKFITRISLREKIETHGLLFGSLRCNDYNIIFAPPRSSFNPRSFQIYLFPSIGKKLISA